MARPKRPGETWLPIAGFEGLYEVSDLGRVRSVGPRWGRPGKVLALRTCNGGGYPRVALHASGERTDVYVHQLVAEAFCERWDGATEIDHINADRLDNRSTNLEWVDHYENMQRAKHVKLSVAAAQAIREARREKLSQKAIAERFGVSQSTVSRVLDRTAWISTRGKERTWQEAE